MAEKAVPMALLKLGYNSLLLPMKDAVQVFPLLADARLVEYVYSAKSYKYVEGNMADQIALMVFPATEMGKLMLEAE